MKRAAWWVALAVSAIALFGCIAVIPVTQTHTVFAVDIGALALFVTSWVGLSYT